MGTVGVVILAPVLDDDLALGQTANLGVKKLALDAGVKGFDEGFCHGAPGSMNAAPG